MPIAKKPHRLHECRSAQEFLGHFEVETGRSVHSVLAEFVGVDDIAGVLLGGSLPLGLGTSASDIDLVVVVRGRPVRVPRARRSDVVYHGESPEHEERLVQTVLVSLLNGVEVDIQVVLLPVLKRLAGALRTRSVLLTPEDVTVLGTIKRGWELPWTGPAAQDGWRTELQNDSSLEIHSTVMYFVFALKELEDAEAALGDNLDLAVHLGRSSVERVFSALLASRGFPALSRKWLRFLGRYVMSDSVGSVRGQVLALSESGLDLLFPARSATRPRAEDYLREVREFLAQVRRFIELDIGFKVAFSSSSQI